MSWIVRAVISAVVVEETTVDVMGVVEAGVEEMRETVTVWPVCLSTLERTRMSAQAIF